MLHFANINNAFDERRDESHHYALCHKSVPVSNLSSVHISMYLERYHGNVNGNTSLELVFVS